MKKFIIYTIIILIIILLAGLLINLPGKTPNLTKSDCDEFGICREGLTYIIKNETFTITKETCLKIISNGEKT